MGADGIKYEVLKVPISYFKPDLLQPRKRFDPERLEELKDSLREEGMINLPIAEKMTSKQYRAYVMQYPESTLKKKLLAEIKNGKTYYLDVVGHRRYIGALKAGYNNITAKVVTNLPLLKRRMIQTHEGSQLSFTLWARAKSTYDLYHELKELHKKNGDSYSLDDFSRYTGIGRDTIRMRFRYVEDVSPEVKRLVEKERTVRFGNAVIISMNVKDKKKQFKMAVNYGGVPEKRLRDILKKPEAKLELEVQTQKEIDGRRQELATIKDGLYKIVKLKEIIPQLKKALRTGGVREEQQKLREKLKEFEGRLSEKEKTILQYLRGPKKICNDTKHYERLEKILSKAYLENQRNRLEKDPEIGKRLIHSIPIDNIDPDPENPRGEYEETEMENLTDSIREVGLLNPILVEKTNGRYKIVVGHRRIEAVRRAGQKNIDCFIVEELPKHLRLYLQVVEDSQEAFTNDERANSWNQLYDLMSKDLKKETVLTILEFSKRIGKNAKLVGTALRYEKMLSEDVKRMVEEGLLSYSTAIPLTTMVNLNKDNREEVETLKKIQYELAINAILGNYTKEKMAEAVKKELSQKNQMDLFPKSKGGLEGIVGRLREKAYWQMKSLNLLLPHLQTDEGTLKRICSLERTLKII